MIRKKNKAALWCLIPMLALCMLGMLAGCAGAGGEEEPPVPVEPVLAEYEVKLYFVNDAYAKTGDETLEHYLTESRTIQVAEGENPWIAVLEELKSAEGQEMGSAIGADVVFENISVSSEDETLMIVDLEKIPVGGGSTQEVFFIGQIVKTILGNGQLFEDSKNIDKVQFLLQGEPVESLMGHVDASRPFADETY